MAEHEHGSMNIEDKEWMFAAFVRWSVRAVIVIIALLIFLALVTG